LIYSKYIATCYCFPVTIYQLPDASGGTTNTITHVFITTSASGSLDVVGSGGNVLFIGALDASKTIASGDIFRINQNNLTIELK